MRNKAIIGGVCYIRFRPFAKQGRKCSADKARRNDAFDQMLPIREWIADVWLIAAAWKVIADREEVYKGSALHVSLWQVQPC